MRWFTISKISFLLEEYHESPDLPKYTIVDGRTVHSAMLLQNPLPLFILDSLVQIIEKKARPTEPFPKRCIWREHVLTLESDDDPHRCRRQSCAGLEVVPECAVCAWVNLSDVHAEYALLYTESSEFIRGGTTYGNERCGKEDHGEIGYLFHLRWS